MKIDAILERYCLDARSFEEKNARSLALGKERLAAGKTGQAMRLFAYNHALNQNKPKTSAQAGTGTKWKVRVWKNNKVVKTLTVEKDDEPFVTAKVKGLGIDWDKATVHDPKTMKQQKNYKNVNASKSADGKAPLKLFAVTQSSGGGVAHSNSRMESLLKSVKNFNGRELLKIAKNNSTIERNWSIKSETPRMIVLQYQDPMGNWSHITLTSNQKAAGFFNRATLFGGGHNVTRGITHSFAESALISALNNAVKKNKNFGAADVKRVVNELRPGYTRFSEVKKTGDGFIANGEDSMGNKRTLIMHMDT